MIDTAPALLDILDTAGQEEYSSMQDQWMRDGKGFLLVYSITQKSTFEEIALIREKILRAKDADSVPMVLVGNKCDLSDERQVKAEEGRELAKQWGCEFMEASAKDKINNEEVFFQVVREIRKEESAHSKGGGKGARKGFMKCTLL